MSEDPEAEAEELLSQSAERSRTDPTDGDQTPLSAAIAQAFDELEAGEMHPNLTFRDESMRAAVEGLSRTDELSAAVETAAAHLDRDPPADPDKSDLYRLLIRAGLDAVDPAISRAWQEGYRTHRERQLDDTEL